MADRWTIRKEINLGDVLTMLGMVGGMLTVGAVLWASLDSRIVSSEKNYAILEQRVGYTERELAASRSDIKDALRDIKSELSSMNEKLDRKADKK